MSGTDLLGHDQDVTLGETTSTVRNGELDDDERDGQRDATKEKIGIVSA